MVFDVTLSGSSLLPVGVKYAAEDGTATGGSATARAIVPGSADAGTDFTTTSGTLTFDAGVTDRAVSVDILGDTEPEEDETFQVLLRSPTNASIDDGTGVGTITDDDGAVLYLPVDGFRRGDRPVAPASAVSPSEDSTPRNRTPTGVTTKPL